MFVARSGVQGEVYQADLPGMGAVAVKISRRNDDYAQSVLARVVGRWEEENDVARVLGKNDAG